MKIIFDYEVYFLSEFVPPAISCGMVRERRVGGSGPGNRRQLDISYNPKPSNPAQIPTHRFPSLFVATSDARTLCDSKNGGLDFLQNRRHGRKQAVSQLRCQALDPPTLRFRTKPSQITQRGEQRQAELSACFRWHFHHPRIRPTGRSGVGAGRVERGFMLGFTYRLLASSTFQSHLKEKISESQQITTLNPTYVSLFSKTISRSISNPSRLGTPTDLCPCRQKAENSVRSVYPEDRRSPLRQPGR